LKGTLVYTLNGRQGKLTPGQSASIKPYEVHTFWNDPSTGEDLDVLVTTTGEPPESEAGPGFGEEFVRNFCKKSSFCLVLL
jgi:quercetin dioxygenase-like cupin family protein